MSFWNAGPSHLCFLSAQHCIRYVLGTVKRIDYSKLIQTQPQVYDTPAQTDKLVSFFFSSKYHKVRPFEISKQQNGTTGNEILKVYMCMYYRGVMLEGAWYSGRRKVE